MSVQISGTKSEFITIAVDEVSILEIAIDLLEKRHPRLYEIAKIDEAGFIRIIDYDGHNHDPYLRQTKELATEQDKYYFQLREQLRLLKIDYYSSAKLKDLIDKTPVEKS